MFNVGLIGYSNESKFNIFEGKKLIVKAFDKIENLNKKQICLISGYTNVGIPRLGYEEASRRNWYTIGFSAKEALQYDLYPVCRSIIIGEKFGDESIEFLNSIDCLIKIGGGIQSEKEIKLAKEKNILCFEYNL